MIPDHSRSLYAKMDFVFPKKNFNIILFNNNVQFLDPLELYDLIVHRNETFDLISDQNSIYPYQKFALDTTTSKNTFQNYWSK